MYQVSNSFLQAMDDISRTLAVEVEISGVRYPTDAIIRFDLERGAFDTDVFTIGQTTANALTLEIFTTPTIQTGDEIKLFTSLRVGEKDERVPLGVYYVDSATVNKEKMTLTCYDKMVTLIDEYIPSANHTTLAALFEDVLSQIGMTYDGVFHDAPIKAPLYGYTYRETLGFIASLNGGNMGINRAGHLEIQRFQVVERAIPAKACFSFEVKDVYRVSKVFCQFGDVGITRGDSSGQCVAFENPYVTEQNIDVIYNQLNGLSFTAATLNYRGDLTLDPGDIFQFTDYKGDIYPLMCGRNKLTFNGGLSGQLESIGESETTNSYAESQLKYKKNITKLTAELGKIQGVVQEIEQSHDGLEERVKKAELEITADAIKSKVENHFVAKDEINGLVTEEQLQSAITQSADSISAQVSTKYETKATVETKINDAINSANNTLTTTIANYYTKEETNSQINVAKNEINLGVSQTYETKTEVTNKIEGLDFDNTNYVRNGGFSKGLDYYGFNSGEYQIIDVPEVSLTGKAVQIRGSQYQGIYQNILNASSGDYTVSFCLRTPCENPVRMYSKWEGFSEDSNFTATNEWTRVSYNVSKHNGDMRAVVFYMGENSENNNIIQIHSIKVEKGNKATQWTPNPLDVENSISNLSSRVSTAESKITADAITNTVKQNFYTKQETENQITSKGYQTESQVQQTVNAVKFSFQESGGYNLLKNSKWDAKKEQWTFTNDSYVSVIEDAAAGTNYLRCQTVNGATHGCSQTIKVEKDNTYVASAKVDFDNGAIAVLRVQVNGSTYYAKTNQASQYRNKVLFVSFPVTTSGDAVITLYTDSSSTTGKYARFRYSQVELGSEFSPWSPNPYEIYGGVATIDKDKVRIEHSNGSYSQMAVSGFKRFDAGTSRDYHYLSSNGVVNVSNGTPVTVTLPSEFKGKDFKVTLSIFKVNIPSGVGWNGIYDIDSYTSNVDRSNAKFTVEAMVKSVNGQYGTVDISYVVIA